VQATFLLYNPGQEISLERTCTHK